MVCYLLRLGLVSSFARATHISRPGIINVYSSAKLLSHKKCVCLSHTTFQMTWYRRATFRDRPSAAVSRSGASNGTCFPAKLLSRVTGGRVGTLQEQINGGGVGFPPRTFTVLHVIDIVMYDKIIVLGWQKIAKVHTPVYLLLLTSVTSVRFVESSTGSSEILTALAVVLLPCCCTILAASFHLHTSIH